MNWKKWLRTQWDRVGAWLCIAAGVVTLIIGWVGAAATEYPAEQLPFIISGGVGGALLVVAGSVGGEWGFFQPAAVSTRSLLGLGYLIVFGSLIAFSAFTWLLREAPPGRVATYAYVNPAVAVMLGWLVASEPFGPRELAASAVIVAGVALIISVRAR